MVGWAKRSFEFDARNIALLAMKPGKLFGRLLCGTARTTDDEAMLGGLAEGVERCGRVEIGASAAGAP